MLTVCAGVKQLADRGPRPGPARPPSSRWARPGERLSDPITTSPAGDCRRQPTFPLHPQLTLLEDPPTTRPRASLYQADWLSIYGFKLTSWPLTPR
jgi:hypothetical protein